MTDTTTLPTKTAPDGTQAPERDRFWMRIAEELASAIGRGIYPPGERLPSEHVLAQQFGVHRHTVRRSLADLGQRGLVRSTQGLGTFVEAFAVDLVLGRRTRHRQNLAQAGVRGGLRVLQSKVMNADDDQARALDMGLGQPLLWLLTLGDGEGHALHVSERCFPLPRFERLAEGVRETGSITLALAAHGVADYLRQESRISARMPSTDVAQMLEQPANRPVLLVTSLNVDTEAQPIEYARTWFAGDRVTLTVNHED